MLDEIVRRLRAAFSPAMIYHFGSSARGTAQSHSDIDLLVIVPESDLDFFRRSAVAVAALRGLAVPIDVQVYTRDEFEQRAALPISFERTVKESGRVLYAA